MDFHLPEELQMLKDNLRRFVDNELIPIERKTNDGTDFLPGVQNELEEKARGLGLWMFDVPEEYGGLGLGHLSKAVMWEEMARTIAIPARNCIPSMRNKKSDGFIQLYPERKRVVSVKVNQTLVETQVA